MYIGSYLSAVHKGGAEIMHHAERTGSSADHEIRIISAPQRQLLSTAIMFWKVSKLNLYNLHLVCCYVYVS